jgi:hypothetical protein
LGFGILATDAEKIARGTPKVLASRQQQAAQTG